MMTVEKQPTPVLRRTLRVLISLGAALAISGCSAFFASLKTKSQIFSFNGQTYRVEQTSEFGSDNYQGKFVAIKMSRRVGDGDTAEWKFVTFAQLPANGAMIEDIDLAKTSGTTREIAEVVQKGKKLSKAEFVTTRPGGHVADANHRLVKVRNFENSGE